MIREEIKEAVLNDKEQQFRATVTAQITALCDWFIKKEIFTKDELVVINKLTDEYVEKINDMTVDKIMESLNMEEENE